MFIACSFKLRLNAWSTELIPRSLQYVRCLQIVSSSTTQNQTTPKPLRSQLDWRSRIGHPPGPSRRSPRLGAVRVAPACLFGRCPVFKNKWFTYWPLLLVAMHLFLVAYCSNLYIVSTSFLLLVVRHLLLVAMPGAPSSVLATVPLDMKNKWTQEQLMCESERLPLSKAAVLLLFSFRTNPIAWLQ